MKYIATRSFYEGDTLHEEGSAFEHDDKAYIEKLLADGNIAAEGNVNSAPSTPEPVVTADEGATADPVPLEDASEPVSEVEAPKPVEQPTPSQIAEDLGLEDSSSVEIQ